MRYLFFFALTFAFTATSFGDAPTAQKPPTAVESKPAEKPKDLPLAPIPEHPSDSIPQSTSEVMEGYENSFLKMFITLIVLIAAIFITVWALRRLASGRLSHFGSNRAIQIIEKRPLSQKTMLYLVEVSGKQTLIAESQLEVKKIASWDRDDTEEESS